MTALTLRALALAQLVAVGGATVTVTVSTGAADALGLPDVLRALVGERQGVALGEGVSLGEPEGEPLLRGVLVALFDTLALPVLVVLARDVLKSHPGATIIADVKASQVLFDEVAKAGGVPLMWKTGHSLIKQKMAETGSPLAGEMSGHTFFADKWYGFDDAPYSAVRLLGILGRASESLADMRRALPRC